MVQIVELVSLTDGHGDMDPMQVFPASDMDAWKNEYSDLLDSEIGSLCCHTCLPFLPVSSNIGGN